VIPEIGTQIGANLTRIVADRGYRGHNAPPDHKFKVYISGQRRRVTEIIKRELRRRSAVEPVVGHAKAEHRMGRNYLAGTQGDAVNTVLAAAGYNFRGLLEWLALLLSIILGRVQRRASQERPLKSARQRCSRATSCSPHGNVTIPPQPQVRRLQAFFLSKRPYPLRRASGAGAMLSSGTKKSTARSCVGSTR
jgi:hypothetical protein